MAHLGTREVGHAHPTVWPVMRAQKMWIRRLLALVIVVTSVAGCVPSASAVPLFKAELVTSLVSKPLFVTHAPGDFERIFIVEQDGRIMVLDIGSNTPTVFLDITDRTSSGGERGLLGLAFHPDYQNNGLFYVDYTNGSGDTRISEFAVSADPDVADETTERVLMVITQPFANHNGGWIGFGPNDGYLYIATGDGGSGGDPDNRAQDLDVLLGKMLRIDVNGVPYNIPPNNPFVGVAGRDEIWAYGLRNPWRDAFDSETGDFYIGDVGQSNWEEVDIQDAANTGGDNWGWRCREGAHDFQFTDDCGVAGTPSETLLDPVYDYSHGGGRCSITGGEVYRGCAIPSLLGSYFFADFCSNTIWSFQYSGGPVTVQDRTADLAPGGGLTIRSVSSFGRDAAGEIYICDLGGEVFKIVPNGVPSACHSTVPAASSWGITAMTLTLMAIGTIIIIRRRSSPPPPPQEVGHPAKSGGRWPPYLT